MKVYLGNTCSCIINYFSLDITIGKMNDVFPRATKISISSQKWSTIKTLEYLFQKCILECNSFASRLTILNHKDSAWKGGELLGDVKSYSGHSKNSLSITS